MRPAAMIGNPVWDRTQLKASFWGFSGKLEW
jgi:hypothetical protein